MDILTLGAAFMAGILTFLNPCVLPMLPIVFGTATNEHRLGPIALIAGLSLSFTTIGLFIATIGFSLGLDASLFRYASAIMLIVIGGLLSVPRAQYRLQMAMGPITNWAASASNNRNNSGAFGQFGLGILLGAMWSPCVGPTLGAASLLAAQGQDLGMVTLAMLLFGIGAALPLALLGIVLRNRLASWRSRLLQSGQQGRLILGICLIMVGIFVLSGVDKTLEILFLDHAPAWMSSVGTYF